MSVEAKVKAALDVFGDPVEKSVLYAATKRHPLRYYTFSCDSFGDDFGDDAPGCERCLVQIHLFAPLSEDCTQRVKATKEALFAAGFTWPRSIDATDSDGQHIVFECEAVEADEGEEAE